MNEYVIQTQGLTKSFGGFIAVDDVNLNVEQGTIHALIGPNGAGKSTCFNLITKFLTPTSGKILYKGRDITALKSADIAQLGMLRSFQISAIFPQLTVIENVRVALQKKQGGTFNFLRSERSLETLNEQSMMHLSRVGLEDYAKSLASDLPYGRKRALEIATTLALDPEVMLLDEPLAGMGREDIRRTSDLIRQVAESRTVLMVEHNLSVVAELSDRITVLARGAVLAEGSYKEVSDNPEVISAYMGSEHV